MVDRNLIGRCGLYCGACGIYRAYQDGEEYRQKLGEVFKCPPEKVRCEGCQALTPECWGNGCEIVKCLNSKGFQFCYECSDFESHACEKYEKFSNECMKHQDVDPRASLARIKAGDVDEWLRECEKKFRCPYCGEPLPSESMKRKCYHCGKALSS